MDRGKHGLCLLSLDGGGVRGLSTLCILQGLMKKINAERGKGLPALKPCDVFDLIGGTSTGGLIAIMLGRLEMDVESSIQAYTRLMGDVFGKRSKKIDWRLNVKGQFSSAELEKTIKSMIPTHQDPEKALLNDGQSEQRKCKAFVCALRESNTTLARLRSYDSEALLVEDNIAIWQAGRATSAATSFFDPITIGEGYTGRVYVDSALGFNNPIDEVWAEAQDIWTPDEGKLEPMIKCIVSIGTGNPGTSAIGHKPWTICKALQDIATQTENTERMFAMSHRDLLDTANVRYFRFNVEQGLQDVGLEEFERHGNIVDATAKYLNDHQTVRNQFRDCAVNLSTKEFWYGDKSDYCQLIPKIAEMTDREQFQLVFSLAAAPEIDYFVGRASNLTSIESLLFPFTNAERKIVVLHGLGGIGKSQLAIEFAKKHRDDYTAVLWLNAKTEATLKRSFTAYARRLPKGVISEELFDGPQNEEALNSILRKMMTWLGLLGNDRWLIIYDNVDNPKIPDNKSEHAYDIRSYFPEAHQGSILVTTRWKSLRIGHLLEVAKLSKVEDSLSLLDQTSGRNIGQDPGTNDLLEKLDGLPLALATAGAYLGLTSIPVSEYLHHHKTSWLELQRTSPQLLSYEDQTIYSTWNLSYICIREEDESAAKLLELWAYFDNRDVWYDLLKAGDFEAPSWFLDMISTELAFKSVIAKLQKHALVERLTDSDGYSMHHCVHAWVRSVLCTAIEDHNLKLALDCIRKSVPFDPAPGDWIISQRLLPHSEKCLRLLREWMDDSKSSEDFVTGFFYDVGFLYRKQGKLTEAESMFQWVLTGKEKAHGPESLLILSTVNHMGTLYREQGRLVEAESMYQRALNGYEKALGKDHRSTIMTIHNLGGLYNDQGKLTEAELMYQRALLGKEKVLGKDHISTLNTIHGLGNLYYHQGKLTEAESVYQRVLIGQENALGKDHTSTLEMVFNIGRLYHKQGRLTEAKSMYQRVLIGQENALGKDHTSTLKTIYNLGTLFQKQGKLAEAESMYQRALIGRENALGKDHTFTLDTVYNLGKIYQNQGRLLEAGSMFQRALIGYEKSLGQDHPFTLKTVYNLGMLYQKQGKLAEAESILQQALIGQENALGQDHHATLKTIHMLARIYQIQRKTTDAESMYQRTLLGYIRNPPPKAKSQADLFYDIGLFCRDLQDFGRAKDFFQQAHEGSQKALGIQHPDTTQALEMLNREIEREKQGAGNSKGQGV